MDGLPTMHEASSSSAWRRATAIAAVLSAAFGASSFCAEADGPPAGKNAPSWKNVTSNVGGEKWGYAGVTIMAAVPGADEVIAGVSEAGLWSSKDGGETWSKLGAGDKVQIRNRPYQIVFDPKYPKTFWVSGSYGDGIFRTTDGGATFERVGNLAHVDGISVDFADPDRKTLLAGLHEQERSVHMSSDGGKTWEKIGTNLPEKTNFPSDPIVLDAKTFLCNAAGWKKGCSWGIYRSEDSGATWTQVDKNGPNCPPLIASDGSIYWSVCWGGGMLKSGDKGKTWAKLPGPAKSCPVELPGGKIAAIAESQVLVSDDGGQSWKKLGDPMPFKASGFVFAGKRKCLFAWRSSEKKTPQAIVRFDLSE